MNRDIYITKIKTLLNILKSEIKDSGKLNLLDINVHAEDFFRDFLNKTLYFNANDLKNNKIKHIIKY